MAELVGHIACLYRFPVKSMRGQAVEAARLGWNGLEGDRRYAFTHTGNTTVFPWLTARHTAALLRYDPYFTEPDAPGRSPVRVKTPSGADLAIDSEELLAELIALRGAPVQLLQIKRGIPDNAPLSFVSNATLAEAARASGVPAPPLRFRMNVVVETAAGEPFEEERWLGRTLRFGEDPAGPAMRADLRDPRCVMVNLDPETTESDKRVHTWVVKERDGCLGVYATPERLGSVAVGQRVYLA
jgi:hypothetical protein